MGGIIGNLRAKVKGVFGEGLVDLLLRFLPKEQYSFVHGVILKNDRGTSQIDQIVVSQFGIFVIETKNYSGWIGGKENASTWVQILNNTRYRFNNPIHQNYGHIKALQSILPDVPADAFFSIVAFPGDCTLKATAVNSAVGYYADVVPYIKAHTEVLIDPSLLPHIMETIDTNNINSFSSRREHTQEVRDRTARKKAASAAHICPRCGSPLVLRNGKYGSFYGCSAYPACHYMRELLPEERKELPEKPDLLKETLQIAREQPETAIPVQEEPEESVMKEDVQETTVSVAEQQLLPAEPETDQPVPVSAEEQADQTETPAASDMICPKCGAPLVLRHSDKRGDFYGCSAFPKCWYTRPVEQKTVSPAAETPAINTDKPEIPVTDPEVPETPAESTLQDIPDASVEKQDMICPRCGSPLIVRHGRYGAFIGCSAFPHCRYTRPLSPSEQQ